MTPAPTTSLLRALRPGARGIAGLAAAIASIAWLAGGRDAGDPPEQTFVAPVDGSVVAHPVAQAASENGEKRFTLRLGQGFRFKDRRVVVRPDDGADLVFKYVPPYVGGLATRYNPISQQVETGLEPTLTAPMPLLLAAHIRAFAAKPDVAKTTSGDIASYDHQAPFGTAMRHVLLMNPAGDQYLLRLDALEAPAGDYDAWRIGFSFEPVQLPLGLAGGKLNRSLPGRIVYRDWYRTKMIMRVDLTTGREEAIADGTLPSVIADRWLGYADTAGAFVVRDGSGEIRRTTRFNEQVLGPVLAADGARLLGSVYRPGPDVRYGSVRLPGAPVLAVGIFDGEGREIVAIPGYDDANWTPDGRLIATGKLTDPGLFEIDPASASVTPIDAQVRSPSQPCVSPDGRTIAFVTGGRVWLIDRDGANLRQLLPDGFTQQRPVFAPDGTMIALVICNTLAADMTGEVFVIDIATREVTPLRTSTGQALVPDTCSRLHWIR